MIADADTSSMEKGSRAPAWLLRVHVGYKKDGGRDTRMQAHHDANTLEWTNLDMRIATPTNIL